MTAIVHGWCRYVEKANDVVFQQMVLNKLWIPDVLIDIIKDFLYISADAVLRKYYRIGLNLSITSLNYTDSIVLDIHNRPRIGVWSVSVPDGEIEGRTCLTCGDCSDMHHDHQYSGCCPLILDVEGDPQLVFQLDDEEEEEGFSDDGFSESDFAIGPLDGSGGEEVRFSDDGGMSDDGGRTSVLPDSGIHQEDNDENLVSARTIYWKPTGSSVWIKRL